MIKNLFLVYLITIYFQCYGHKSPNCAIQFNKSFYCNGDTAWFKVWVPENLIAEKAIAKVRIKEIGEENILDEFHLLVDSSGGSDGYILIPNTTPSGSYTFAVVLYDKDTYELLLRLYHLIVIINDSTDEIPVLYSINGIWNDLRENNVIAIETKSVEYHPREEIQLNIQIKDGLGASIASYLSISVVESENFLNIPDMSFSHTEASGKGNNHILITENAWDNALKEEIINSNLLLFVNETGNIIQGTTNEYGQFNVQMEAFTGMQTIQCWDYFGRDMQLSSMDFFMPDVYEKGNSICRSNELKDYLERNVLRKKINYIFHVPGHTSVEDDKQDWQIEPDFVVESSNYEPFKDLKEFMETVITPLKILKNKDGLIAKMVNPQSKPYFAKEPIFIIDHVLSSFKEVLDLDMYNIRSIEFYNRTETLKRFGLLGENGIVAFNTNKFQINRYEKKLKVVNGLQGPVMYPKSIHINVNKRQPLLGTCIYWNPDLKVDAFGFLRISFFHNDEPGIYKIRILGKLENGEFIVGESSYRVIV